MELSIIIVALTCLSMILCVLFKPQFKLKNLVVDSYWVIVLIGAIVVICSGLIDLEFLGSALIADSSINPIKILVLFISMTVLSIFLDEVDFFRYLANLTLKKARGSQLKLFTTLYIVVSVLTVFTSNDIIVLTFTPFICHFAKNAKINPVPYLVCEFIAANTMSMTLIIGNPTNIYIATAYGINFLEYAKIMILPTLASALLSFALLLLIFRKDLKVVTQANVEDVKINNKPFLIIGLTLLSVCTVALAVGPYIGLDMWIISLVSALLLFIITGAISIFKKSKSTEIVMCLKRAPWQLIPFVLSMFVMILALQENGVTGKINELLGSQHSIFKYGISSFLFANVINNIPMSVLFCPIIEGLTGHALTGAIYGTIIGSNLGALLTPIGALAGIMWTSMLKKHGAKYSYATFIKNGVIISVPSILVALLMLSLII